MRQCCMASVRDLSRVGLDRGYGSPPKDRRNDSRAQGVQTPRTENVAGPRRVAERGSRSEADLITPELREAILEAVHNAVLDCLHEDLPLPSRLAIANKARRAVDRTLPANTEVRV